MQNIGKPNNYDPPLKPIMKTINVYLTKEESNQCKLLQNKYRVSLSTLADKVIYTTYNVLTKYGNEDAKKLMDQYISKGMKTSIKPRCVNEVLKGNIKERQTNTFSTNALKIYLSKNIKKYIQEESKEKAITKYYADIDRELQKTSDPNWDYNNRLRSMVRLVKQNKEYFKKFIE